jgi:hypothetical protein
MGDGSNAALAALGLGLGLGEDPLACVLTTVGSMHITREVKRKLRNDRSAPTSQPTALRVPLRLAREGFALSCLPSLWVSSAHSFCQISSAIAASCAAGRWSQL